ncbi:MAG: ATP-dependent DNA ligase [Bacteroidetes bacterium]|nr:ATP-dependent DNA ligase [Bacteroidota bacterium]
MKAFTDLYHRLNQTNSSLEKQQAMEVFFRDAPDRDAVWGLALLSGRMPVRLVGSRRLRGWVAECTNLPDWLVDESYQHVGDLAETLSLLLAPYRIASAANSASASTTASTASASTTASSQDLSTIMLDLIRLKKRDESEQKEYVLHNWRQLDGPSCFLFNKFITGGFRLGVGQGIAVKALSNYMNRPVSEITQALMGNWDPADYTLARLLNRGSIHSHTLPYPFFLASPLISSASTTEPSDQWGGESLQNMALHQLGSRTDWMAEWKWDGIRIQMILREGVSSIWSRGEERLDDAFPEIAALSHLLPHGTVIDGELLCGEFPAVRSFQDLQKRLGRTKPSARMTTQHPVFVYAYDLLELDGQDIRQKALSERRWLLEKLVENMKHPLLHTSPLIDGIEWSDLYQKRLESRRHAAEGIMLKRASSGYESGRRRGYWWKWKLDPMQLDAVLLYARPGHGRRSNLFTDYSMAIWDQERTRLLPIAQVYSGLTDTEIREVDAWIKGHTTEKFGPVRTVVPQLVFEIGFDGIQRSGRHKAGIALRFPRILRWRRDKLASEADDLGIAEKLLKDLGLDEDPLNETTKQDPN